MLANKALALRTPVFQNRSVLCPRGVRLIAASGAPISSNDFKNGLAIEVDNVPYKVAPFGWTADCDLRSLS